MKYLLALFLVGCSASASQRPLDMAGPAIWDMKCLGREGDEGKEVYWNTWWSERECHYDYSPSCQLDKPTTIRVGFHDRRYVCRNHPTGWWFEQVR